MSLEDENKQTHFVILAFGSNLGDRYNNIKAAYSKLLDDGIIFNPEFSSFYETEPVGMETDDWFLNSVVVANTTKSPKELLNSIQELEKSFGRTNKGLKDSRYLDIDIIIYDNFEINEDSLKIPHPSFHERKFVLIPAAEVEGNLKPTGFDKNFKELAELCKDNSKVIKYK